MTKSRMMFLAVLVVATAQALLAARYGIGVGGRTGRGFFEGGS